MATPCPFLPRIVWAISVTSPPSTIALIECSGSPLLSVLTVSFSYSLCRVTPLMFASAPSTASNGVRDGSATLWLCRTRNSSSCSTATPTVAAVGFVTDVQPRVGVLMLVIVPDSAATAPVFAQVAVTVTVPSTPIDTLAGRFQITLLASFAEPFVIVAPTVPIRSRSTVEFVAPLRAIPLILTLLARPAPYAVEGE